MNIKPNILIFSVFQKTVPVSQNDEAHKQVLQALKDSGIPCAELLGRYDGVNEMSILVQGFEYRSTVERACKAFNQECYLESHNDRATFLVFPNGDRQAIGTLTAVSKEEAEALGAYSYSGDLNQHFVTK